MLTPNLSLRGRPFERLLRYGPTSLNDEELFAVILGRDAYLGVARELLKRGLLDVPDSEASRTLPLRQRARIEALFEVHRRLLEAEHLAPSKPVTTDAAIHALIARYGGAPQEHFGVLYLDARRRLISERQIALGTLNGATVSRRDVFRHAILDRALFLILFHNHPSGDTTPSSLDIALTGRLVEAGKLFDVEVLDHLIVGRSASFSMREAGYL